jgi:hypothetical protein
LWGFEGGGVPLSKCVISTLFRQKKIVMKEGVPTPKSWPELSFLPHAEKIQITPITNTRENAMRIYFCSPISTLDGRHQNNSAPNIKITTVLPTEI